MSAFFAAGAEARLGGAAACLRCLPDEITREAEAMERAFASWPEAEEGPSLEALAGAVGYSPFHFHRLFKRATGVTPAAYARALRSRRAEAALASAPRITDAVYESGYSGPARFYEDAKSRLGMTPPAGATGGAVRRSAGRWPTLAWGDAARRHRSGHLPPGVRRGRGGVEAPLSRRAYRGWRRGARLPAERTVAAVNAPERPHDLPLDVRGTAFQEAVWRELARIPPGETLSYARWRRGRATPPPCAPPERRAARTRSRS
jgi:AraC family transcriptional regulator of adaptative response/methylated-DNA-[protein]-cysteine methyltransferase